jgi:RNA polymerase sigma-70 factor (ECF subfamily)
VEPCPITEVLLAELRRGSVRAWVMSAVRSRAIDALRTDARHDTRRADEQHANLEEARDGIDESVVARDEAAHLGSVLARLPAAQRDVIALAYFGGMSATEIASEMSLPLGTVKSRMRLGLDKLRCGMTAEQRAADGRLPR